MMRSFMKRFLILGLAVTLIFTLASCGRNDEKADSTDMSGTVSGVGKDEQGSEPQYKDFDMNEYVHIVPRSITFYNRGQHIENLCENRIIYVYKEGILDEITGSNESHISFIEKYFPRYLFGTDDYVTLEYLGEYYGEYKGEYTTFTFSYFKVNVNNTNKLTAEYKYWKPDDEIYMVTWGFSFDSKKGEPTARIFYYIKNFTQDETATVSDLEESENATGEISSADWSTYCTEKTISTELYTLTVPDSWINVCAYDTDGAGLGVYFEVFSEDNGIPACKLFDICVLWDQTELDETLRSTHSDYLGTIDSPEYGSLYLVAIYHDDMQTTQQAKNIYEEKAADFPQIIQSITPVNGVTITK